MKYAILSLIDPSKAKNVSWLSKTASGCWATCKAPKKQPKSFKYSCEANNQGMKWYEPIF